MAKLRLTLVNKQIIMRKIILVTIDSIEFKKKDYEKNRILQNFYFFIKRHSDKINFITYKDHSTDDHVNYMYLKNGNFHNIDGPAFYSLYDFKETDTYKLFKLYAIDGEKMEYDEWLKKSRLIKLHKLNNIQ